MLAYYCAKCSRQNPQPRCEGCGRSLGNPSVRYVWEDSRPSIFDTSRLGLLLRVVSAAVLLAVGVMLVMEYVLSPSFDIGRFFQQSGILPAAFGLGLGLAALGMLVLLLQGRETVQYMLEPRGVLRRTWIRPTRLKCWARMIRHDRKKFQPNNEGKPFLLAHEEYLAWADAARYKASRRAGRITLYRPYAFVFMTLWLPRQEYDGAAEMVAAKLKGKR